MTVLFDRLVSGNLSSLYFGLFSSMNWLGGSVLILYYLFAFLVGPSIILYKRPQDQPDYLVFYQQIICSVILLVYIVSQRHFNGFVQLVCGLFAGLSQLLFGYTAVLFLFRNWSRACLFTRTVLISDLILPVILAVGLVSLIVGLIALLFWGSIVWIIDLIRVDRFKQFKTPGNTAHVIITGGGTGLGRETAIAFAKMGTGHITVISRSKDHLEGTKRLALAEAKYPKSQQIHVLPCDVTNAELLYQTLSEHIQRTTIPDMVICAAGMSFPNYFFDTPDSTFQKQADLNYMGCVHTVRALAPAMLSRPRPSVLHQGFIKESHSSKGEICLVSSALGVMGCIGYSMYTPTKYAVRGLAECLRQEFAPLGLNISCFYPSNMKTESFAVEMLTKPVEARRIDEQAATITPKQGTAQLMKGLERAQFHISTEWLIDGLRALSNGISPSGTPVWEFFMMPAIFIVGRVYRWYMDLICEDEAKKKKLDKTTSQKSSSPHLEGDEPMRRKETRIVREDVSDKTQTEPKQRVKGTDRR